MSNNLNTVVFDPTKVVLISPMTASWAVSASYALTGVSTTAISASWASQSLSASYAPSTPSSSAISASWASQSLSASYAPFTAVATVPSASWASQSLSASCLSASVPFYVTNQTGPSIISTGAPSVGGLVIRGNSIGDTTLRPLVDVSYVSASWYCAKKETLYTDGNLTPTWTDFGPGGRTLYKGGAETTAPKYRANYLNGNPVFEFSASSQMSASLGNTDTFFRQDYQSVFLLFRETSLSSNWWEKSLMSCDSPTGGNCNKWIFSVGSTGQVVWACHLGSSSGDNEFDSTGGVVAESAWTLAEFTKNGSTINVYINGTNVLLNQNASYYPPTIPYPFTVGWSEGTTTNTFTGQMAEFLFYSGSLSTDDRQKIEGYLLWKYGLQANLPGGHPYYSSSPTASEATTIQQSGNLLEFSSSNSTFATTIDGVSYVNALGQFVGSASYATTASYALNGGGSGGTSLISGSTYSITASWAVNAVNSTTASYALNGGGGGGGTSLISGSTYPITASWAVNAVNSTTDVLMVQIFS
jgi:hypothetical protein